MFWTTMRSNMHKTKQRPSGKNKPSCQRNFPRTKPELSPSGMYYRLTIPKLQTTIRLQVELIPKLPMVLEGLGHNVPRFLAFGYQKFAQVTPCPFQAPIR